MLLIGFIPIYKIDYVEIDNHKSDFAPIGLGVPQGSILGRLLLIIYTNDIQYCSDFNFFFFKYFYKCK